MKKSFSSIITLVMLSLFAVSCGNPGSNVLSGVKVETTTVDNDVWMSFAADLNLGAMSFGSIALPIMHPRSQAPVGRLELISGFSGQNQLKISVNVSELADVQTSQAVLPNGNLIPLIGMNQTIAINIGNGARVYLTLGNNVTAIGVAVPIEAFDSIGRTLPGLNFFPVVTTGEVIGTAGIFTGLAPGQNGIAVIADVSKVVNLSSQPTVDGMMAVQAQEVRDDIELDYRSHSGNKSQKSVLDQMIYKLHQKKTILRIR